MLTAENLDFIRAELRKLDADALYERTKEIVRMGERQGWPMLDWHWSEAARAEWSRRGNLTRYADAELAIRQERRDHANANARAIEELRTREPKREGEART